MSLSVRDKIMQLDLAELGRRVNCLVQYNGSRDPIIVDLLSDLFRIFYAENSKLDGIRLQPFGSIQYRGAMEEADVDISAMFTRPFGEIAALQLIKAALEAENTRLAKRRLDPRFRNIRPLLQGVSQKVLKFHDADLHVNVDLTVNEPFGPALTGLIRQVRDNDLTFTPLLIFLKCLCEVSGSYGGGGLSNHISSTALALFIIHFFMQPNVAHLSALKKDAIKIRRNWNADLSPTVIVGRCFDFNAGNIKADKKRLDHLAVQVLEYFVTFDFENRVVDLTSIKPVDKHMDSIYKRKELRKPVGVRCPLRNWHNLGRCLNTMNRTKMLKGFECMLERLVIRGETIGLRIYRRESRQLNVGRRLDKKADAARNSSHFSLKRAKATTYFGYRPKRVRIEESYGIPVTSKYL